MRFSILFDFYKRKDARDIPLFSRKIEAKGGEFGLKN
jgi:hypothetical protein